MTPSQSLTPTELTGRCLVGAPLGGLIGLIAAGKGRRGRGFLYGMLTSGVVCPVNAYIFSTLGGVGTALGWLSGWIAPIAAGYYLSRLGSKSNPRATRRRPR